MTSNSRNRRGGRPHKGDRQPLICRVPSDLAELVIQAARSENMTLSDYVARTLAWTHGYPVGLLARAAPVDKTRAPGRLDDERWPNPDLSAAAEDLLGVMAESGLDSHHFASAMGISRGVLNAYLAGRISVPIDLFRRMRRVGLGLRRAEERGWTVAFHCGRQVRAAVIRGDVDLALTLCREQQRCLREAFATDLEASHAWQSRAMSSGSRGWDALLAALVEYEFTRGGLRPPEWTMSETLRLRNDWVLCGGAVSRDMARKESPNWLRERRIFVSASHLLGS